MVSPLCEVNSTSLGGWVTATGGVYVTTGETVSIRLADSAGAKFWSLDITSTDELTIEPALTVDVNTHTASFVMPVTPANGIALKFTSIVGVGAITKDANFAVQPSYTTTFKIGVLAPTGIPVLAVDETLEGSTQFGWCVPLNTIIRTPPGSSSTPAGAATGDLGGSYPAPSVLKIHGSTVPIGGSLTTGNILQVTGAATLGYAPLNLAGGANFVTGLLPIANFAHGTADQVFVTNGAGTTSAWVTSGGDLVAPMTANAVVALTGAAGVVNAKKTLLNWTQDLGPDAGFYQMRITPSEVGTGVGSFQFGTTAYTNVTGSRLNQVFSMGWNLGAGGAGVVIGAEPAMGLGFESHYAPGGGGPYMEHHTYFITAAAVQRRPMTWTFNKTTSEVQGVMSGDRLTFQVDAGALQTMVIQHGVSPVTITLGRFNQLPVVLRNEYTDTPFLQQNSSTAYVEIVRVTAAGTVLLAQAAGPTKTGGSLAVGNLTAGGFVSATATTGVLTVSSTVPAGSVAPGTNGQVFVTATGASAWVTPGGDWLGPVATNTVIGLTGTTGTVAMHGTKILWDSNGPSVETLAGSLQLKLNTTGGVFRFVDTTHTIGDLSWNGSASQYDVGATAAGFGIIASGTQYIALYSPGGPVQVTGGGAAGITLDSDLLNIRTAGGTVKANVTSSGIMIGANLTATQSLDSTGTARFRSLGTGVGHLSSTGVLSSSLIVNADIDPAAVIAVSKLAPGTSGQILVTNATPATVWATAGGDWTGAVTANTVIGLTGTAGTVAMHGTSILWDSNGPSVSVLGTSLQLKLNTTGGVFRFVDTTHTIGDFAWNGSATEYDVGSTAAGFGIIASGTQYIALYAPGGQVAITAGSSSGFQVDSDFYRFRTAAGVYKGYWDNTGLRIGSLATPGATLDVVGNAKISSLAPGGVVVADATGILSVGGAGSVALTSLPLGPTNTVLWSDGNSPIGNQWSGTPILSTSLQVQTGAAATLIRQIAGGGTGPAIYFGAVTPSASNFALSGTSTTTSVNAPTEVRFAIGAAAKWSVFSDRLEAAKGVAALISHAAQTTDVATADFTIQSQAAAGPTNVLPGNLVLSVPAPVSGTTHGYVRTVISAVENHRWGYNANFLGTNGALLWAGLGADAPTTTNYSFALIGASASSTNTVQLNVPNAVGTGSVTSSFGTLAVAGTSIFKWKSDRVQMSLQQAALFDHQARTTNAVTFDWTFRSQAPFASAGVGNQNSGSFIYDIPAPVGAGTSGLQKWAFAAAVFMSLSTSGLRIGDATAATHTLEVAGSVQVTPFGTGIVHSSSTGVLTSSGIVDADITGTISVSKLVPGSNGQILTVVGGVATWGTDSGAVTLAGDVTGPSSANTVVQLTGSAGSVAIPAATKLAWASSGPSLEDTTGDFTVRLNTAGKNFAVYDTSNLALFLNYNGGNPYIQFGGGGLNIQATGTQTIGLVAASTGEARFQADLIKFYTSSGGATKGNWTNVGLRIGDATSPVQALEVVGTARLTTLGLGIVHASATGVLSSSTLVDADVAAGAAIAVTKLALGGTNQVLWSNGSANSWTGSPILSTSLSIGATVASAGAIRLANNTAIEARNAANSNNITLISTDSSDRVLIGASAAAVRVSILGTGIVHSDASGTLTSSLIVDADVSGSAALAVSKLGGGTDGQVLQTVTATPTWSTYAGDVTGKATASTVIGLTGTANVVAMHGTSIKSDAGLALTIQSGVSAGTDSNFTLQTGGTNANATLALNVGTNTFIHIASGALDVKNSLVNLIADSLFFNALSGTVRGNVTSGGWRIGDGTAATNRLEVVGDIKLIDTGSHTGKVTTNNQELVLEQTGDSLGTSRFRLQSRSGVTGAILENAGLDLVDLKMQGSAGASWIRQESRAGQMRTLGTEFQFGAPGSPTMAIGHSNQILWLTPTSQPTLGTAPSTGGWMWDTTGALLHRSDHDFTTTIAGRGVAGLVGVYDVIYDQATSSGGSSGSMSVIDLASYGYTVGSIWNISIRVRLMVYDFNDPTNPSRTYFKVWSGSLGSTGGLTQDGQATDLLDSFGVCGTIGSESMNLVITPLTTIWQITYGSSNPTHAIRFTSRVEVWLNQI